MNISNNMLSIKELEKLAHDLDHRIRGEVFFDELHRLMYSVDASILEVKPLLVACPLDKDDVCEIIKFSREKGIPVAGRGAGSAMTGASLLEGIIVDFTKHMNRVLEVNAENDLVRVQPGVVYASLNKVLKSSNKFFPPDPSSGDFCTIGGMVANNSGGIRSVKYGATKDYVRNLEVILSDLSIFRSGEKNNNTRDELTKNLYSILKSHELIIMQEKPHTLCNSSGYNIFEALNSNKLDYNMIFTGSEGTLGLFTEIVLAIKEVPHASSTAIALFDDLKKCEEAIAICRESAPSALEIMDKRIIEIIHQETDLGSAFSLLNTEALLLIEFHEDTADLARIKVDELEQKLMRNGRTRVFYKALDEVQQNKLWQVRKVISPILKRRFKNGRSIGFIEDTAVIPEVLPEYISFLRKIFASRKIEAAIFGHAGKGNLHINPEINTDDISFPELIHEVMDEVFGFVLDKKGTITGEHGDGLLRSHYTYKQYPRTAAIMKKVKEQIDPFNILNPGKVLGDNEISYFQYLRYGKNTVKTQSRFDRKEYQDEIVKCNGCGTCRSYCPIFKELGDEEAGARAKAVILRGVIENKLDTEWMIEKEFKRIIDLCVNCKLCTDNCPSGVDIPGLCSEARRIYVGKKGQTLQNKVLIHESDLSRIGSHFSALANIFLSHGFTSNYAKTLLGIDKRRQLPLIRHDPSLTTYESPHAGKRRLIYFPGCYALFHYPEEAWASIYILEKNGAKVKVLPFNCCGVVALTQGDPGAEKMMHDNLMLLKPYIEDGWEAIASSSSCSLTLKQDYRKRASEGMEWYLAGKVYDLHEYLFLLKEKGELSMDFAEMPCKVAFHVPCHLTVQSKKNFVHEVLKLIPGVTLCKFEDSCCGIAGSYGFKKKNYQTSMNIGKKLFDALQSANPDYVVTSCGTCKIQLEQGLKGRVFHSSELIASSYKGEILPVR